VFKFLSRRDENPGFADAVLLTNKSQHWLCLTEAGHRAPPLSHVAMDSASVNASNLIDQHVRDGNLVVTSLSDTPPRPRSRKKKKQDISEVVGEITDQSATTPETTEALSDTLVAQAEPENWVSSNESIVGLPTTDEF
jgi:hypothetical protein